MDTNPKPRTSDQHQAAITAALASGVARRRRVAERAAQADRRRRQFTPAHHPACVCDDCTAARTRLGIPLGRDALGDAVAD